MIEKGEKMFKITITLALMFSLCSCEIFGWDSSGGNNEGVTSDQQPNNSKEPLSFYIELPLSYPKQGSAVPEETVSGSVISISDLTEQDSSEELSTQNALRLTSAACDQGVTAIININVDAVNTNITWLNENTDMGSLTLSNEEVSDPPLQLITCIN